MDTPSLVVKDLVKHYGSFKAVNGISFTVPRGKVIGLLGPNGAGKTTTIQMLLGITTPTSGQIDYFGWDFAQNRQACLQKINYASAYNTLQFRISVWENLLVFAGLYSIPKPQQKIEELLDYFKITRLKNEKYQNLSSGEQTRVNLAKALLNDPDLILMDEPTASLDPDIADKTLSLIEELREHHQTSILFTSHNMSEVARICDEVIFLDHGRIVKQDNPLQLSKTAGKAELSLVYEGKREDMEAFLQKRHRRGKFKHDYQVSFTLREGEIAEDIQAISARGLKILDIEIKKPDLEDVFMSIARKP